LWDWVGPKTMTDWARSVATSFLPVRPSTRRPAGGGDPARRDDSTSDPRSPGVAQRAAGPPRRPHRLRPVHLVRPARPDAAACLPPASGRGGTRRPGGGRDGRRVPKREPSPEPRPQPKRSDPSTPAPTKADTPVIDASTEDTLTAVHRAPAVVAVLRRRTPPWPGPCRSATARPRPGDARPGTIAGPPSTGPCPVGAA